MFTYDEERVVRSEGISLINQIGAPQGSYKLVVEPFLLQLFANHLFAHLSDAAVEWNGDASLNAPVVAARVWISNGVVAQVEGRDVKSRPIA